jgi:hypothetical protein
MLTSNASHSYECVVEKGQEAPFPLGGKAHVVINGKTQKITIALRDMLDGDGKPVRSSVWDEDLTTHLEDKATGLLTFAWEPLGLLDFSEDRNPQLQLLTIIPFADWPAWVETNEDSAAFYGSFACHEV